MNILNYLDIENLSQHLLLANTPHYLYKHYSRDLSIQKISKEIESSKLIEELDDFITKGKKDFQDFVVIYSLVISLLRIPDEEVSKYLKGLEESNIRWVKYFVDIYFAESISGNVYRIDKKFQTIIELPNIQNVSVNNSIEKKIKPTFKIIRSD